jgi:hypothetical protein
LAQLKAAGMTPLDFMLASMGDVSLPPQVGLDAAKAAAPYIHPEAPEKRIIAGDPDNAVPITAIRPIIVDPVARYRRSER